MSQKICIFDIKNNEIENSDIPFSNTKHATAYVDGSFNASTKVFGYSAIIFFNSKEIHLSDSFSNDDMVSMHNVAGEIYGALAAMEYAIKEKAESLTIYHDYIGIWKWCTGEWKAKKKGTILYKEYCDRAKEKLELSFVKVKGHSGDKYNEIADLLAKKACGLE